METSFSFNIFSQTIAIVNLQSLIDNNEIYQNTIQDSCEKLNIIQKDYDNYCLGINENCKIPEKAILELSQVMSNLEDAFSNAGFVLPYNEIEETGIE